MAWFGTDRCQARHWVVVGATAAAAVVLAALATAAPALGQPAPRWPAAAAARVVAEPAASAGPDLPRRPSVGSGQQCAPGSPSVATVLPWPQRLFAPARIWQLSTGDGVLVAVVDSGVSRSSTSLADAVATGVTVVGTGRADADCLGHGTFVAGIIAARPQPGSAFVGLAPGARILPVRVTDQDGKVSATALATGIRQAADAGAGVINVSMNTAYPSDQLHDAVRYATGRGALVVAAAADQTSEGDVAGYPAAYPEVLAVAAVQADGRRASFSGTGRNIAVAAPGVAVTGVGVTGAGHFLDDGTSFAAAFVSATAALVRAYRPGLTPAQVVHRIEATADRPGRPIPDLELGYGVVNPYAAVSTLLPEEWPAAAGPAGVAPPPRIDLPAPADGRPARTAYLIAGGAVGLAGVSIVVTAVRRRRPARQASPSGTGSLPR